MNGLGTALPDRDGGGKKKPEDDGDDAADPDVRFAAFPRVSSPLPRRSSLARSRASPRDAPRAISPSRAGRLGERRGRARVTSDAGAETKDRKSVV